MRRARARGRREPDRAVSLEPHHRGSDGCQAPGDARTRQLGCGRRALRSLGRLCCEQGRSGPFGPDLGPGASSLRRAFAQHRSGRHGYRLARTGVARRGPEHAGPTCNRGRAHRTDFDRPARPEWGAHRREPLGAAHMKAANRPEPAGLDTKLLWVDPARPDTRATTLAELPELLSPRDLLVVNDAATLPASLFDRARAIEVRLVGHTERAREFRAVLLGEGDYRTPTEQRPPPRAVRTGEWLTLDRDLRARVQSIDPDTSSLVLCFEYDSPALFERLY